MPRSHMLAQSFRSPRLQPTPFGTLACIASASHGTVHGMQGEE